MQSRWTDISFDTIDATDVRRRAALRSSSARPAVARGGGGGSGVRTDFCPDLLAGLDLGLGVTIAIADEAVAALHRTSCDSPLAPSDSGGGMFGREYMPFAQDMLVR
jgi:hypothetical protein